MDLGLRKQVMFEINWNILRGEDMADDIDNPSSRQSGEFTERAILETLIPFKTDVDIESELGKAFAEENSDGSFISRVRQRQQLFFDESFATYIVLQTHYVDEATLKSYLSRLAINLDVHIVNSRPSANDDESSSSGGHGRDHIFSNAIKENDDPLIIVQSLEDQEESNGSGAVLVVWKMDVVLNRPRTRIASPMVTLAATAHLRPSEKAPSDVRAEEYLPSGVPAALNLLESFVSDPVLAAVKPRLSALRVSRVAPMGPVAKELLRPLKTGSQKTLSVLPALSSRVRYSRLNTHSSKPTIMASLDFDVMPFLECEVTLEKVELDLGGGTVEMLGNVHDLRLPISCNARDNLTFLYRLVANQDFEQHLQQTSNVRILTITISATVLVAEECRAPLKMMWRSNVDFSAALNPAFGGPSQLLQRNNRPSSLPTSAPTELPSSDHTASSSRPASDNSGAARDRSSAVSLSNLGLTITFTGPTNVYVGEVFYWNVFLVNGSDRARKLALVVIPRRRSGDAKTHSRPLSSASAAARHNQIAEAVVDENIVYAMQRSAISEPAQIVTLNTEVRVG
ncbi:MAG: hypothetical protein M4579_001059 [Chaenotheca gracillima]|nr:MAG: hypothetical protein M4579_001059 [Chaenotheca gracillima]